MITAFHALLALQLTILYLNVDTDSIGVMCNSSIIITAVCCIKYQASQQFSRFYSNKAVNIWSTVLVNQQVMVS